MLYRCFLCARLESMYWNSVSTFGALLHFQYHRCEEIIYFSINFSTTFNASIKIRANRCYPDAFIVQDLNRSTEIQYPLLGYFFTFSTSCEEIVYLLSLNASIKMKSHRANRCYPDALILQDLNWSTEIQYPLLGHFFIFSTKAVKR